VTEFIQEQYTTHHLVHSSGFSRCSDSANSSEETSVNI